MQFQRLNDSPDGDDASARRRKRSVRCLCCRRFRVAWMVVALAFTIALLAIVIDIAAKGIDAQGFAAASVSVESVTSRGICGGSNVPLELDVELVLSSSVKSTTIQIRNVHAELINGQGEALVQLTVPDSLSVGPGAGNRVHLGARLAVIDTARLVRTVNSIKQLEDFCSSTQAVSLRLSGRVILDTYIPVSRTVTETVSVPGQVCAQSLVNVGKTAVVTPRRDPLHVDLNANSLTIYNVTFNLPPWLHLDALPEGLLLSVQTDRGNVFQLDIALTLSATGTAIVADVTLEMSPTEADSLAFTLNAFFANQTDVPESISVTQVRPRGCGWTQRAQQDYSMGTNGAVMPWFTLVVPVQLATTPFTLRRRSSDDSVDFFGFSIAKVRQIEVAGKSLDLLSVALTYDFQTNPFVTISLPSFTLALLSLDSSCDSLAALSITTSPVVLETNDQRYTVDFASQVHNRTLLERTLLRGVFSGTSPTLRLCGRAHSSQTDPLSLLWSRFHFDLAIDSSTLTEDLLDSALSLGGTQSAQISGSWAPSTLRVSTSLSLSLSALVLPSLSIPTIAIDLAAGNASLLNSPQFYARSGANLSPNTVVYMDIKSSSQLWLLSQTFQVDLITGLSRVGHESIPSLLSDFWSQMLSSQPNNGPSTLESIAFGRIGLFSVAIPMSLPTNLVSAPLLSLSSDTNHSSFSPYPLFCGHPLPILTLSNSLPFPITFLSPSASYSSSFTFSSLTSTITLPSRSSAITTLHPLSLSSDCASNCLLCPPLNLLSPFATVRIANAIFFIHT